MVGRMIFVSDTTPLVQRATRAHAFASPDILTHANTRRGASHTAHLRSHFSLGSRTTAEQNIATYVPGALGAAARQFADPRHALRAACISTADAGLLQETGRAGVSDREMQFVRPLTVERAKIFLHTAADVATDADVRVLTQADPHPKSGAVWVVAPNADTLHRIVLWHFQWPTDPHSVAGLVCPALDRFFAINPASSDFPVVDIILHDPKYPDTTTAAYAAVLRDLEYRLFNAEMGWAKSAMRRPQFFRIHIAPGRYLRVPVTAKQGVFLPLDPDRGERFSPAADMAERQRALLVVRSVQVLPDLPSIFRGARKHGIHPDLLAVVMHLQQPNIIGRRVDAVIPREILRGADRATWWKSNHAHIVHMTAALDLVVPNTTDGVFAKRSESLGDGRAPDPMTAGADSPQSRAVAEHIHAVVAAVQQLVDRSGKFFAEWETAQRIAYAKRTPESITDLELYRALLKSYADLLHIEVSGILNREQATRGNGHIRNTRWSRLYAMIAQCSLDDIRTIFAGHSKAHTVFILLTTGLAGAAEQLSDTADQKKILRARTNILEKFSAAVTAARTYADKQRAQQDAAALARALATAYSALLDDDMNPVAVWDTFAATCAALPIFRIS